MFMLLDKGWNENLEHGIVLASFIYEGSMKARSIFSCEVLYKLSKPPLQ